MEPKRGVTLPVPLGVSLQMSPWRSFASKAMNLAPGCDPTVRCAEGGVPGGSGGARSLQAVFRTRNHRAWGAESTRRKGYRCPAKHIHSLKTTPTCESCCLKSRLQPEKKRERDAMRGCFPVLRCLGLFSRNRWYCSWSWMLATEVKFI